MDIWGVEGIEAEAELLSAITTFFKRVGITSDDVGLKVNSRAVLAEVLAKMGVPEDKFAATCVLVDKLEKVEISAIKGDMEELGLTEDIIQKLLDTIAIKDLDELEKVLGETSPALQQIKDLFTYAEAYGFKDWLVFDASVVRGLAYYTGLVFEGFDRQGELRAICGGGRYDKLLEAFGGAAIPAVGFGFGDAVIVELLKDKGVLPSFATGNVDAVVFPFSRALFPAAAAMATSLREQNLSVDLVLEEKKPKWLFKQAERVGASHVIILGEDEVAKGVAQVKNLATGQQSEVVLAEVPAFLTKEKQL